MTRSRAASKNFLIALLGCLALPLPAQNILLEESTGSDTRRAPSQAIDIRIGDQATSPAAVRVENPGTGPAASGQRSIELNPGEFTTGGKPEVPVGPAPVPEVTPAPTPSPAVIPANATIGVDAPDALDLPVTERSDVDDPDFFPSGQLGKEKTVNRGGQQVAMRPDLLKPAPLDLTVPDVYSTTFTNGLKFYHLPSHDLPRVRITLLINAGSNLDPADKVGLAEMTARTMRSGGAGEKPGDEIDQELEHIGSEMEFNVEKDHVAGGLFALADKTDQAMGLLADVLLKPRFDEPKFQQQKAQEFEELRRQNDDPSNISRREFRKILYGGDHPLARSVTSASLAAISRDDVRAFHDERYRPSTVTIGVSGDISQEDARALVEKHFGQWTRPEAAAAPALTVDESRDTTSGVFITRKATAQSQIRLGHIGLERRSPLAYAANVLNSIYGTGGFSSRLMNEVRTKHGYVYGVGGSVSSDDPKGLFGAIAASKLQTTGAAIKALLDVTRSVIDGPISEDELETARRDVFFTFMNQFATPNGAMQTQMLYDYRGYDKDYLKNFPEKIKQVTLDDVKSAAKELLHLDRIKIYVVGNEAELDMPLSDFGPVQEWPVEEFGN